MEIELDLSRHCIETAIRRRYNVAISLYFKATADQDTLEAEIDLLRRALLVFDFHRLRSHWPDLGGHVACEVRLMDDENGDPLLRLAGTRIKPPAAST